MIKNTKQRLFEVMGKLDKTFKPKLNEDLGFDSKSQGVSPEIKKKILNVIGEIETNYETRNSKAITDALYYDYKIQDVDYNTLLRFVQDIQRKEREQQMQDFPRAAELNAPEDTGVGERPLTNQHGEYMGMYEAEKSSYSDDMVNDIKTLLGTRTALSPKEIEQLATDYQVGPEEVQQTMQYVLDTNKENQPAIPQNSQEAQEVNDFFKFLKNNPKAGTVATVWYASTLDRYLAKPKQNDMVGRFIKLTKYGFEWERTYSQETEKVNPEWQVQQRKGGYTQVEGFSVVKRDKNGDEVFDIVPRTPKSIVLILDESGNVVDTLKTGELQGKYAEKFQPSFFAPAVPSSGSGVPFRALKLYAVKRLAAGGKEWINNKFKYEKYSNYFEQIPEPE